LIIYHGEEFMAKAYELCWIDEALEDRGLDTLPVVLADAGYLAEALSARGGRPEGAAVLALGAAGVG